MAKATPQAQKEEIKVGTAVAVQQGGALAVGVPDFAADAGRGMEGATSESYAIPFLNVLQKGSPQVDEASGVAIEGAKAGMLFETVTQKMIDGKVGAIFIPCAYKRVFIQWGPREGAGQGFKGEHSPETVAQMRADGKIKELDGKLLLPMTDGSLHEKKCDRFSDTRNHYGLLLDTTTGIASPVLLSLTSTQIKKSKMLMSLLAGVKVKGSAGMFTPPTFANLVKVTSLPESNDKGTWYGVKFELAGPVATADLYQAAKAFHLSVTEGQVAPVNYEQSGETHSASAADADGKF